MASAGNWGGRRVSTCDMVRKSLVPIDENLTFGSALGASRSVLHRTPGLHILTCLCAGCRVSTCEFPLVPVTQPKVMHKLGFHDVACSRVSMSLFLIS